MSEAQPTITMRPDGTMSRAAIGLYATLMSVTFVLICIAGSFSIAVFNDSKDQQNWVEDYCCRTSYEVPSSFSPYGSCVGAKTQLIDTFHDTVDINTLGTTVLVFVCTLWGIVTIAFTAWIYYTVSMRGLLKTIYEDNKYRKTEYEKDTDKQHFKAWYKGRRSTFAATMVVALVVGVIAITVSLVYYTFVHFQNWNFDYEVAGCCCCYNDGTKLCDRGASCNASVNLCMNNAALKQHLGSSLESVADTLMPVAPSTHKWSEQSLACFVLTFIAFCMFMAAQFIGIFISKPTNSKVEVTTETGQVFKIEIDQTATGNWFRRALRGSNAEMGIMEQQQQQHLRKRASNQLNF